MDESSYKKSIEEKIRACYPKLPEGAEDVGSDSDESESDEMKEWIRLDESMSSDGTHEITPKEFRRYNRQINSSGGFDVAYFPKVALFNMIDPLFDLTPEETLFFTPYAKFALLVYEIRTGKSAEFVEIIKVNTQFIQGQRYYITFSATPADGSPNQIFQAQVMDDIKLLSVELVRLKPNP